MRKNRIQSQYQPTAINCLTDIHMKQFKQLLGIDAPIPTRNTRTLSFQALAKHNMRYAQHNTINQKLQKMVQPQPKQAKPQQPRTARQRKNSTADPPTHNLRRIAIKKPSQDKIQGIPIITSMTASTESQGEGPVRLNTEEREEITDKMMDIKEDLIKELKWNKRKLSLDPNGTLRTIRKELDDRTEKLVDEVLARRNNKDVYLKARQEVKIYFSKKKQEKPVREKTLGTPCFEGNSDIKLSNAKQSNYKSLNSTIEEKKPLGSTGFKLTVTKKSGDTKKAAKDTIITHRTRQQEVLVQEFKLQ